MFSLDYVCLYFWLWTAAQTIYRLATGSEKSTRDYDSFAYFGRRNDTSALKRDQKSKSRVFDARMQNRMKHNNHHRPITLNQNRFMSLNEDIIGLMKFIYRTLTAFFFTKAWQNSPALSGLLFWLISHEDRALQGCNSSACERRWQGGGGLRFSSPHRFCVMDLEHCLICSVTGSAPDPARPGLISSNAVKSL